MVSHKSIMMFLTVMILCLFTTVGFTDDVWDQYKLWYEQPASKWLEALPIGNGQLGAMVFGGTIAERIQLNDDTVWAGPPIPENRKGAAPYVAQARQLIFEGKYVEAQKLVQQNVMGERIVPRSYQTLGDVHLKLLNVPEKAEPQNYYRDLNLDTAVALTRFTVNGIAYTREVFSSAADQVIVVRMSADKPGSLSLEVSLDRPADYTVESSMGKLDMFGQAQHKGKHLGVKWNCQVKVSTEGGTVRTDSDSVVVEDADAVVLYIASATDYNKEQPSQPLSRDRKRACSDRLGHAKTLQKIA